MSERVTAPEGTFKLGGDLEVRRLGFGAMRVTGADVWGEPADRAEALRVLRRAVALGVGLIDTADCYGPEVSERLIAETLHPYPAGLVIATKGGVVRSGPHGWEPDGRPAHLREALEASLHRLRLERMDLYQLHTIDSRVPLEESVGTLAELRAAGKIRHVGLSNVDVRQLERARRVVPIVSVQNHYHLANRGSDPVLQACTRLGLAFIPYFPLGDGRLVRAGGPLRRVAERHQATPAQVALAWLLRRSPCMLPIPGTGRVKHLEENVAAAGLTLGADDLRDLERP
ncbi:MAG: aldo/keto reductase [Deltaproteobacteria bacterium]|nr:aldo/keto reductase [Deltaproteobacteria bacterium]